MAGPAVVLIGLMLTRTAQGARVSGLQAPPLLRLGLRGLGRRARGLNLIPPTLVATLGACSSFLLLAGVGAISAKLGPKALLEVKPRLAILLVTLTVAVAILAYALTRIFLLRSRLGAERNALHGPH